MFCLARYLLAAGLAFCVSAHADPVLPPAFSIDITAVVDPVNPGEGVGYAGVGFDGTNFWVARWATARVTRISPAGAYVDSFDIPGLTGIRAMTWDGSHFWMSNNTSTLSRVDPVTRTVVGTLAVPVAARYVSFDADADNGQGGFWIGNFNDDILLVSMTGTTLATLPAASVAYAGRYGVALDPGNGNPGLWAYFQGGANAVELGRIDLPSGVGAPATTDLFPHLAPSTSGVAGGAFITSALPGGQKTLLTLCQCTPNNILLGIELQDEYTVGGTLSGLAAGASVVLQNNGGDDLVLGADGPFTFDTQLPDLAAYAVTVLTQPSDPSQTCTVDQGSGAVAGANVTNVVVTCVTDTYTVTPSAGPGGSIDPDQPQLVPHGDTAVFTVVADGDHVLDAVGGSCGGTLVGDVYTTDPVLADCDVVASFLPRVATTTVLGAAVNPVRVGESAEFEITVSGSSAPADGQVVVTASTGESCVDLGPPTVDGNDAVFGCSIVFATLGPRTLGAEFSASATHLDSASMLLPFGVARVADLSVSVSDGESIVATGQALTYLVEVRNDGPDDAPGTLLLLTSDPALADPEWTCVAVGAATCPAAGAAGEIAEVVDLPTGTGLDFLQHGEAADPLGADLTVTASVAASGEAPDFVSDPVSGDNQSSDVNLRDRLFADSFED